MRQVDHFIVGGAGGTAARKHQIWNPSTGEVQAEVPLGDAALLDRAVATAKKVQPEWAATNPQRRARVMFEFKRLVEANKQELAELLASEHGKVVDDAHGLTIPASKVCDVNAIGDRTSERRVLCADDEDVIHCQ